MCSCEVSTPAVSVLRFRSLSCENETFSPCSSYRPHQMTPSRALLPPLELSQQSCPGRRKASALLKVRCAWKPNHNFRKVKKLGATGLAFPWRARPHPARRYVPTRCYARGGQWPQRTTSVYSRGQVLTTGVKINRLWPDTLFSWKLWKPIQR